MDGTSGFFVPDVLVAARSRLGDHARVFFQLDFAARPRPVPLTALAADHDNTAAMTSSGSEPSLEWDSLSMSEAYVELFDFLWTERIRLGRFWSCFGRHNGRNFYQNDFVEQVQYYDAFFGSEHAADYGLRLGIDIPLGENGEIAIDVEILSGDDFAPFDGSFVNSPYMVNNTFIQDDYSRPNEEDLVYAGRAHADFELETLSIDGGLAFMTGAWDGLGDISTFLEVDLGASWFPEGRKAKSELALELEYLFNYSQLHGYIDDRDPNNAKTVLGSTYQGGGLYAQVVYRHQDWIEGGVRFDQLGLPFQEKSYGMPDNRNINLAFMAGIRPVDFVLLKLQYSVDLPKDGDAEHTGFLQAQFGFGWL